MRRALEDSILGVIEVEIPETLIVEQAREKFAIMMTEFKDQGESDEKIQNMINKEVRVFFFVCRTAAAGEGFIVLAYARTTFWLRSTISVLRWFSRSSP